MLQTQPVQEVDVTSTGTTEILNVEGAGKLDEMLLNFNLNPGGIILDIVLDGVHLPKTFGSSQYGLYYLTGLLCHADNAVSPSPLPEDGGSRAVIGKDFANSLVITMSSDNPLDVDVNVLYSKAV